MGPILQERTSSSILKKETVTEKVRPKKSQNTAIVTSNNKPGGKVRENQKPQKKNSLLHKNVISGQDMEPLHRTELGQYRNRTRHIKSPNTGTYKMLCTQFEANVRCPGSKPCASECEEKGLKLQQHSSCCFKDRQNSTAQEKSRRALSLPLAPHQIRLPENVTELGSLRLLEHKEDDTDSASDLSDSERLPVLPSPCTPPQLNLRAEIVDTVDLDPCIPGPRTIETQSDSYNYPDFLPPPFNTWSLRQLAIFLNTEGKRAPRPKPVGQLEMFLERLLKLEWHQIQTIQNESSHTTVVGARFKGHTPNGAQITSHARPHTAPPTRLSSPKSMRQSQRPFPFTLLSSLGSPSSCQLSRCFYCQVRYPLCNGSCSSYTYQRHSRLSPLLERKNPPSIMHKRSNSESRASAFENRVTGRPQYPVSPKCHRKDMEAAGNSSKVFQELSMKSKRQASAWKGQSGRGSDAVTHRDPLVGARNATDKRITAVNKRDFHLSGKREHKEGQQTEMDGAVAVVRRVATENNSIKQTRTDRKLVNAHLSK